MKEGYNYISGIIKKTTGRAVAGYLLEGRAKLVTKAPTDLEELFKKYYEKNYWRNDESVSGGGSTVEKTKVLREKLESLFSKYEIKSILDVPCGDFNWMRYVNLNNIDYMGGDIVPEMVENNNVKYKKEKVNFKKIDITKDELAKVDLIFVRDCFVHLSYENIFKALDQIKKSGSKYLLSTSFIKWPRNFDVSNGMWRPINLEKAPFNLNNPIERTEEESEKDNHYSDKSLCMYSIDDMNIPDSKLNK